MPNDPKNTPERDDQGQQFKGDQDRDNQGRQLKSDQDRDNKSGNQGGSRQGQGQGSQKR